MNIELLDRIEAVGSKLEKERLLREADEDLQVELERCLDPDITYGITVDEDRWLTMSVPWKSPASKEFWVDFSRTLIRLSARDLTGGAAQAAIDDVLYIAPNLVALKWACRLINKNLRAGFDVRTYTKVWGEDRVQKFAVQLADVYEGQELSGLWFFQPKLDGNRVVLIDGEAKSRNGKLYPAAQPFVEALLERDSYFFERWVLDGEMMGDLGFDQSSGALRRVHQKDRKKATFTYWAFDIIDRKEWEKRATRALVFRRNDLHEVLRTLSVGGIEEVPTSQIHDPTHVQVMQFCDEYLAQGFEGAMAKQAIASYVFKRGDNLLKVKRFKDVDLEVIGFYEGKGKHRGRLGGLIVSNSTGSGDGITCKVGSGFDDALREEIWKDQKGWLGATVQVQYQDATKDGSLRFPVFVMRRKDKE